MALGNEAWCGMVDARSVRARVGGCLELEFRDLEGLDGLDTRFNTPWRLPLAGAGGYPVRCARKAATVPISIFEGLL